MQARPLLLIAMLALTPLVAIAPSATAIGCTTDAVPVQECYQIGGGCVARAWGAVDVDPCQGRPASHEELGVCLGDYAIGGCTINTGGVVGFERCYGDVYALVVGPGQAPCQYGLRPMPGPGDVLAHCGDDGHMIDFDDASQSDCVSASQTVETVVALVEFADAKVKETAERYVPNPKEDALLCLGDYRVGQGRDGCVVPNTYGIVWFESCGGGAYSLRIGTARSMCYGMP